MLQLVVLVVLVYQALAIPADVYDQVVPVLYDPMENLSNWAHSSSEYSRSLGWYVSLVLKKW